MKVIIIQNTEKDGREAESNDMKPKVFDLSHGSNDSPITGTPMYT